MPREYTLSNDIYLTSIKKFLSKTYEHDRVLCSPKMTGLLLTEYNSLSASEKERVHQEFRMTEIKLVRENAVILVNTDLYNTFLKLLELYSGLSYEEAKDKFVDVVFSKDSDLFVVGTPKTIQNKEKKKKVELIQLKKIAQGKFPEKEEHVQFYEDYLQRTPKYTKSNTQLCELLPFTMKDYTDAFYKNQLEECNFMKLKQFCYPDVQVEKYVDTFFHHFDIVNRKNVIGEQCYDSLKEFNKSSDNRKSLRFLSFEKDGIASECTLKTSYPTKGTDSIVYEHRVGQFINTIMHRYTCFVKTYQLYKIKNDKTIQEYIQCNLQQLPSMLEPVPKINNLVPIFVGCINQTFPIMKNYTDADKFVVCTKYVPGNISLYDFLSNPKYHVEHEGNILQILYQVYYALNDLRDNFTHYDLHTGNVLLCHLGNGAKFVYPNVTFHCKYLAKIIDYGRCYYYINPEYNSRNDLKLLNKYCTKQKEVQLVYSNSYNRDTYWNGISANRNMSHDLRLINNCMLDLKSLLSRNKQKNKNLFYQVVTEILEKIDYVNHPEKDKEKEVDPPPPLPSKPTPTDEEKQEWKKKVRETSGLWKGYGAPETEKCEGKSLCNVEMVETTLRQFIQNEDSISKKHGIANPSVTINCTGNEVKVIYRSKGTTKGGTPKKSKSTKRHKHMKHGSNDRGLKRTKKR